jgi:hypothetical protein
VVVEAVAGYLARRIPVLDRTGLRFLSAAL